MLGNGAIMAGFPKRQQAGDNQSRSEKKSLI